MGFANNVVPPLLLTYMLYEKQCKKEGALPLNYANWKKDIFDKEKVEKT